MQTLFILNREVGFDYLAALLMETALVLTDVASCTFPSRPEPKSACWLDGKKKALAYTYVPDIEIRYLVILNDAFLEKRAMIDFFSELTNLNLFTDWTDIEKDLHSDYRAQVRSINAFLAGVENGDTSMSHLEVLVNALTNSVANNDVVLSELLAQSLREIATPMVEAQLRSAYEETSSGVVRSHLREAINYAMNRL